MLDMFGKHVKGREEVNEKIVRMGIVEAKRTYYNEKEIRRERRKPDD
ncbi:hypothetical protein KTH81_24305 [Lachnospiraceae bacterium ASD3451]|nr:hypothetical protein [Diplocloster agilis]MBU9746950.1 hypothetical protein [Diplocloster agilis]